MMQMADKIYKGAGLKMGHKNHSLDVASLIIENFYNELICKEDQKLFDLAFAKEISQTRLDEFLKNWDIEKYGGEKSLLLSYVMKANPKLKFSDYEKPRLEGLLKFYRFRNLKLISHYKKIVKALNEENIFPLILKGGAMKHIRPDLARVMADIDILIKTEEEFLQACEIAKNLGYVFKESKNSHAFDLHLPNSDEGIIDLHRHIYFENNHNQNFSENLFLRAEKQQALGAVAFIPCFEDLLFLGLINLSWNLQRKSSIQGILYNLFDFKYFLENKPNFDWDLVLQNIIQTKAYSQALLAMKFINKIVPDFLPEKLVTNSKINKKFVRYCNRVMFYRFHFHDLKMQCKNLKIKDAVKNWTIMKDYFAKKPKYFLLKRIVRKSYFLLKIFLILKNGYIPQSSQN